MVTVFLVDDHEVVRRGLIDLLGADPELDVVGEAGSVAEALARIPALRPDVAVLDVRLPDGNGIELCRELLSRMPELRCLILTSFTSDEAMLDAILAAPAATSSRTSRAWSWPVPSKTSAPDARCWTTAPRQHDGQTAWRHRQARSTVRALGTGAHAAEPARRGPDQQADRRPDVLAEKTVKNYVSRLLAKLGMERRTQAAVFATKLERSRND